MGMGGCGWVWVVCGEGTWTCRDASTRGGGDFGRGEFRGENFAVMKSGEIFPLAKFLQRVTGESRGGRLQPVLMRPTPQLSVKTRGGGGGGGGGQGVVLGGGQLGGVGGGFWPWGGVSQGGGACARPTITTCIPPGGCVSGGLGVRRYVCDDSALQLTCLGQTSGTPHISHCGWQHPAPGAPCPRADVCS